MKTLYYFIVWSIKNYEYDAIDIIPFAIGSFFIGFIFGVFGLLKVTAVIWSIGCVIVLASMIYSMIIRPIMNQYRRFRADQRYMMEQLARNRRSRDV
jgi:Mn2+/Fe2+ NRAMP family transporter